MGDNIKKFNIENSYRKSLNIVINSLFNKELRKALFNNTDKELIKNLEYIIGYQNYIEKNILNNVSSISIKIAQIISNFCNKSLSLNRYKHINEIKFEININFLATYLHNIFDLKKDVIIKEYNVGDIDKLFSESKIFLRNIDSEKKIKENIKVVDPLSPTFYPYLSKPQFIVYLKYGLVIANILISLFLAIFTIKLMVQGEIFFNIFLWLIFYTLLSYIFFKMTHTKIDRIKYIFPKVNFFIVIGLNLISIFYFLLRWKDNTDNFLNIFSNNNLFVSIISIFIILSLFISCILSVITYYLNPGIDNEKIEMIKKGIFEKQQNYFRNNHKEEDDKNSNNDDIDKK